MPGGPDVTLFGPDVSWYQSGIQLAEHDWDIDFLIARCVRRGDEVDTAFGWFRREAMAHGVPFAAYAFARPLSMVPLQRQVDAICRAMGDEPVPFWFDHEHDGSVPALSDHDLLVLGGACAELGYNVPTVYTGWYSDATPFDPATLTYLGYDGIVNARYPRQWTTSPPRGDARRWYAEIGGDDGKGWDYDPGPAVSPVPVLVWQYSSACTWGNIERVDWNAIRDPAVLDRLFHRWWTPTPTPPSDEEDPMYLAKLSQDVPEFGLGAGGFVAGNIVVGGRHLGDIPGDTSEVFSQFCCFDMATRQPVASWSQVTAITADEFRRRFGRRV